MMFSVILDFIAEGGPMVIENPQVGKYNNYGYYFNVFFVIILMFFFVLQHFFLFYFLSILVSVCYSILMRFITVVFQLFIVNSIHHNNSKIFHEIFLTILCEGV